MSKNRKESGDDLDNLGVAIEKALHVVSAEEIMGLKETRTLSEILRDYQLTSQEKLALAFYSSAVAQDSLMEYLTKNPEKLRAMIEDNSEAVEGLQILFSQEQKRLKGKLACLGSLGRLPDQLDIALPYRILEQVDAFFEQESLTVDEINLFMSSLGMAGFEIQGNREFIEEMSGFYQSARDKFPSEQQEKSMEILKFCNELRTALGLKPLE